ncbi:cbb3-type cytochrome c oxidase subunit 3 [uncultured Tateyamaria sp.]|uniref:cbb3-type cytochrome c oxidase subunit 3 n=1 Tax=uncultured Tateyamaria sp. TaxID=455651 RepID=UPI002622ACEB|nr:cbb3-type cytochrome c oxidase subunit 3 [uncultured Tateyamaria sp.]
METYTFLRELADSWVLLAMVIFYVTACLWAFRPGARPANEEAARIPFRHDAAAPAQPQDPEAK